ncbi:hypothetical protein K432DRAFT_422962 [Lepidopterella palustris CBS 459.81]|uniref:ABM domain-containing protein n=1 Tax=Lepidopterella palustris CBS 459.81 TaxID=1314670 RepID=A0A8E2JII3_9PEZI|nr:hypothetical protein K432DRAFT_422962 [Lepidopterella palustris CBS 459.81]
MSEAVYLIAVMTPVMEKKDSVPQLLVEFGEKVRENEPDCLQFQVLCDEESDDFLLLEK